MRPASSARLLDQTSRVNVGVPTPGEQPRRSAFAAWILFLALLLPWLFLWSEMQVEWTVNEQYGYGWFVPPFAALLFWLRWADAPALQPPGRQDLFRAAVFLGLFCILLLRLIEIPNPDWRIVQWLHSFICVALSLGFLWSAGGRNYALHFLFPIAFLLVAVPWPSEIEEPLVQGLMRQVAGAVAEVMNLLGIPAQQTGNLIQIRGQVVGVNEACSGIRSLQTSLMAALLLGDLRRLSSRNRLALVLGGLGLALFANFLRSGILVWIAGNQGVAALEHWHDTAGLLVLITVIVGLYAISSRLGSSSLEMKSPARSTPSLFQISWATSQSVVVLIVGLLIGEIATYSWYAPSVSDGLAPWTVRAPVEAIAYKPLPIDNRTRSYLRYDSAIAANWQTANSSRAACTLFFLRWEAGRTSAIRATMHQPHICLTAMGMKQTADFGIAPWPVANGLILPVREYIFEQKNRSVHVFYIVWREGLSGSVPDPTNNRWDRFDSVLQRHRNPASQTLELVVNGAPDRATAQGIFKNEIARLLQVARK